MWKFSQNVYFAVKPLIKIFAFKFHGYPKMKLVFSYKYMLNCKLSLTKFLLLINHPKKLHNTKIFAYTVAKLTCIEVRK